MFVFLHYCKNSNTFLKQDAHSMLLTKIFFFLDEVQMKDTSKYSSFTQELVEDCRSPSQNEIK